MSRLNGADWVALALLVIGGVNWGMIAAFNIDIVSSIFGVMSVLSRIVYGVVGLSALYTVYILATKAQ